MSVSFDAMAGMLGAFIGLYGGAHLVLGLGFPVWVGYAMAVPGLIAGMLIYLYTPLPSTNGGMFAAPATMQKWGFTREPRDGYKDPDVEDVMSNKILPVPVLFAEKEDDDSD